MEKAYDNLRISVCYSKTEFNDDCVRDAILLFSQINEHKRYFKKAYFTWSNFV